MRKAICAAVWAAVAFGAVPGRQTVDVRVRDGIKLATDIYGADPGRPRPVLLVRTPYDKNNLQKQAEKYAAHDYVVVIQDCRGRYASGGMYRPYNNDKQDGYDTIEWLSRQPWSNGHVGMFGGSHTGLVQWLAMTGSPPGLSVIAPAFTASSEYRVAYRDRVLRLALISTGGVRASPSPKSPIVPPLDLLHNQLPLMHLPLATLQDAYGWQLPWMTSLLEHPDFNGFWEQSSAENEIAESKLPVLLVSGYYDMFHHDAMQDFFRLRARLSKAPIQLVIGPWTHGGTARSKTQDLDFGAAARIDMDELNLSWFDRFFRGKDTGPAVKVRYFVMGDNSWKESSDWPPAGSRKIPLYLQSGGKAAFTASHSPDAVTTFQSDPTDPVPSVPKDRTDVSRVALWSPLDYSQVSARRDVASFLTGPLDRDLQIAGPLEAELLVESDVPSSDWVVRLFAVPPAGLPLPLAQGVFRDPRGEPGVSHVVKIDMGSTAAHVRKGELLRVEIAGSNFPLYDRNLHTGEGPFSATVRVAHQKVHHTGPVLSRIILPVSP